MTTMKARQYGRTFQRVTADRIRERREALGWRQEDLAEALARFGLGLTPASVSNVEGTQGLEPGKIVAFAAALGCTTSYLLGVTDDPDKWDPDLSLEEWATRVYLQRSSTTFEVIPGDGKGPATTALPLMAAVSP